MHWSFERAGQVAEGDAEKYLRQVQHACSLLGVSGLAQTIAFMKAKPEYERLMADLANAPGLLDDDLAQTVASASCSSYMRLTEDFTLALSFLKRAAEARKASFGRERDAVQEPEQENET